MIPKVMKPFVSDLQKATENENISWYEGEGGAYICDHKNHTLHISSHFDESSEEASFTFSLVTNGKNTPFTVRRSEYDYDTMSNLYESIIANANTVSKDIKDFFD